MKNIQIFLEVEKQVGLSRVKTGSIKFLKQIILNRLETSRVNQVAGRLNQVGSTGIFHIKKKIIKHLFATW